MNAEIKIDYNSVVNNMTGACGMYHGFTYQQCSEGRGMTDADIKREFERVESMKLTVARAWFRPDFSRDMLSRFFKWLEEMKARNVDVALQSGWWFTKDIWFFAHEKYADKSFTRSADNFRTCCDKFAAWIAKAVEYFIEVKGFTNIKYLMLFTEPISYQSGDVPKGLTDFECYEIICRKIDAELRKLEIRDKIKLVGPNGIFNCYNTTGDDRQLKFCTTHLNDVIDIYSMHTYSRCEKDDAVERAFFMSDYDTWVKHAEYILKTVSPTGKKVWFDEYGICGRSEKAEPIRDSTWYGNYVAMINCALFNAGIDASFIWTLFDTQYFWDITNDDSFHHGVLRYGCTYMPGDEVEDSRSCRPVWYVMNMLSKYLSGYGTKVYKCSFTDGICALATEDNEGKRSVLAVNLTDDLCELSFNAEDRILHRVLYNPSDIEPSADLIELPMDEKEYTSDVNDELGAFAVAVYTEKI